MALYQNALLCAAIAVLFWSCIGLSLARCLSLPRELHWPVAPSLGWAVHSAIGLPVLLLTGLSRTTVFMLSIGFLAVACTLIWRYRHKAHNEERRSQHQENQNAPPPTCLPIWAIAAAAVFACLIMLSIVPKLSDAGAALSEPVFDHAKVAIIDGIVRQGLPAINPFFGEAGGFDHLAYYYLWHFSAAEIATVTGLSGWEADAAMTGYTAFSSLLLMMGFAVWLSSTTAAAGWTLLLAASVSIRNVLAAALSFEFVSSLVGYSTGFGSWLFQIYWAPQHVMSANCALIAIFLLTRLARSPAPLTAGILGVTAAAAYGSSIWIGGVTFPLAAAVIASVALLRAKPSLRLPLVACLLGASIITLALSAPFLIDQLKMSALRADGFPIAFSPAEVLGLDLPAWTIRLLDVPGYWTLFLFAELAAYYPAGLIAGAWLARDRGLTDERRFATILLVMLAIIGLAVGGLLKSTVATNNDLAWRAVLPALLLLIAFTAAALGRYLKSMKKFAAILLILPLASTLYGGLASIYSNIDIEPKPSAERFLKSTTMWQAVRRHAGVNERIANNPAFLADMTNWPINISWALLANRNSCYAGSDLALPFAPLTRDQRATIDALFARLFSGMTTPADIDDIARRYNCAVLVVTSEDGAWTTNPFTANSTYRLVESSTNWKIYRRNDGNS